MAEKFALNNPGTLIVVIGLPGSGKSTYIRQLAAENPDFTSYDDYQGKAHDNDHDPHLSEHYGPLLSDLKQGKTAVVSDVRFSVPVELGRFLASILGVVPNTKLDFRCFANDPENCKKNVMARNRKDRIERELELIDNLSANYVVLEVETIPVHTSE